MSYLGKGEGHGVQFCPFGVNIGKYTMDINLSPWPKVGLALLIIMMMIMKWFMVQFRPAICLQVRYQYPK